MTAHYMNSYDGTGESALGAGITIAGGPGPYKNFYNLTKGVNKNVTLLQRY